MPKTYEELLAENERLTAALASAEPAYVTDGYLLWRAIEDSGDACEECGGAGVYAYGSTATWHGGIGGQAMTTDVCDKCWGSGNRHKPWPSHRRLAHPDARSSAGPVACTNGVTLMWMPGHPKYVTGELAPLYLHPDPRGADAVDAKRYQWLRDSANWGHAAWRIVIDPDTSPRQMDAAIDAAIKAGGV